MGALHSSLISKLPPAFFYPSPVFKGDDQKIIVFDIFWYWNSVSNSGLRDWVPENVERWSFSKADCSEFGFRYNTQFFFDCLAGEAAECRMRGLSSHPKALFVGREKRLFSLARN